MAGVGTLCRLAFLIHWDPPYGEIVVCAYMEWLCDFFLFFLCGAAVIISEVTHRSKGSD